MSEPVNQIGEALMFPPYDPDAPFGSAENPLGKSEIDRALKDDERDGFPELPAGVEWAGNILGTAGHLWLEELALGKPDRSAEGLLQDAGIEDANCCGHDCSRGFQMERCGLACTGGYTKDLPTHYACITRLEACMAIMRREYLPTMRGIKLLGVEVPARGVLTLDTGRVVHICTVGIDLLYRRATGELLIDDYKFSPYPTSDESAQHDLYPWLVACGMMAPGLPMVDGGYHARDWTKIDKPIVKPCALVEWPKVFRYIQPGATLNGHPLVRELPVSAQATTANLVRKVRRYLDRFPPPLRVTISAGSDSALHTSTVTANVKEEGDPVPNENPMLPARSGEDANDPFTLGRVFFESGYFKDCKDAAQATVKILAGRENGIAPFAAMANISIINGKPALGAHLVAGLIAASKKYSYRITEHTDDVCEVTVYTGETVVGVSRFTMEDAKRALLLSNPTWTKYRRNMLYSRAMSNAGKWFCPDLFIGGVYTQEELLETQKPVTVTVEAQEAVEPAPAAVESKPVESKPVESWGKPVDAEQRRAMHRLLLNLRALGIDDADHPRLLLDKVRELHKSAPLAVASLTMGQLGELIAATDARLEARGIARPERKMDPHEEAAEKHKAAVREMIGDHVQGPSNGGARSKKALAIKALLDEYPGLLPGLVSVMESEKIASVSELSAADQSDLLESLTEAVKNLNHPE